MKIINMLELSQHQLTEAAQILTDSLPNGWPTLKDAEKEIRERLVPENTLLAAVDNEEVIGWCGIMPQYDGHVFELHPLSVKENRRRNGIGTALVHVLEDAARSRGGITIWLGADDEKDNGETSLAHVDLYENLPMKLLQFNPNTHQTAFYIKLGYHIVGVMPDANGLGKPDIFLAKRL